MTDIRQLRATRKLIEVALPLEAINKAAAQEKSIRHGHPSTLHLWWSRKPLAACRAVLFAQLVDDPSAHPDEFPTEDAQAAERQRLFGIIERLVPWENSNDPQVLEEARREIRRSCGDNPPPILDPFCGGGSIPLEAQRLGLEAHASDLNPVAVLITKALIEIPPRFAGMAPVHPRTGSLGNETWVGAQGLAADIRWYGQWMRDRAWERIGHLYPKVKLPADQGGGEATVIAWIWARTVKCPNPACGATMPLVSSFWLSKKKGRKTWIEPRVDQAARTVTFEVVTGEGEPPPPPKLGRGAKFRCLVCDTAVPDQHITDEGQAGCLGATLMAVVAEGSRARTYLEATPHQVSASVVARPDSRPTGAVPDDPRNVWCKIYGFEEYSDLFTDRQLVALTTFSDLVAEAREQVRADAAAAGLPDPQAYADAVATYLAFAVDKGADYWSNICSWNITRDNIRNTFGRQAIPMMWGFAEGNPFSDSTGNWMACIDWVRKAVEHTPAAEGSSCRQLDATAISGRAVVATDPPYYDNIGYADLSDFFYVWLRRTLGDVYPDLFSTLLTPKAQELIASPYRHGGKPEAKKHFETGLGHVFERMREVQDPAFPLTLFYAFKQAESNGDGGGLASTGWDTMLEGLLAAGFAVTATWPMRTERAGRSVGIGTNALASSIVLACRPRPADAPISTRKDFLAALRTELPGALRHLQQGSIAPVDLAQASIGPGMAVFSRYAKVLEPDGSRMPVRTALALINQVLDEILAEQEADFDADTRWAVAWFAQHGTSEGPFGDAENLSKAKNTSVEGMVRSGILASRAGKVRLLGRDEMATGWDPATDDRLTVWEVTQHLIRTLGEGGEQAAADLLRRVGAGFGETARELAYRLYVTCDRKGWAQEAQAYNGLVVAWPELARLAAATPEPAQEGML
jgi:putative DNA methylase